MSLLQKSSLCRSWLAVGRTLGSLSVRFMMYFVRTGHLWQNESGIFPSLRSPSVRTRSISVPKGWNSSRASTPMLYMSDWVSSKWRFMFSTVVKRQQKKIINSNKMLPLLTLQNDFYMKRKHELLISKAVHYLWIIIGALQLFWCSIHKCANTWSMAAILKTPEMSLNSKRCHLLVVLKHAMLCG